ncbi:MAG TPA: type I-E CRISPR-associated protein Cse1/CasA [Candidatus Hydrogenedentes bacterium]|nr:type I-E CRISPR-associated protein Cse1/CasA [Candidatus Hydrogenedentota bacterium]HOV74741.1 type I-E CRISPR-associated protein Cse1/CasA [Candidatus Hydrogenedentota bacterium]
MNEYNLLDESWIPVLYRNGCFIRIGIRKALEDAHRIRTIAASNPMDRVAILRFLLALLYWCKGNPPDGANANTGDPFPTDWFSMLDAKRDCFNLLGEGKRFYQYRKAGSGSEKKLAANYLAQEVPTGTNKWHFRHATDEKDGLCPACCAMGLLRLPLFATSGGRGKPPGVNAKPPLYVIPVGDSLAKTLRLSWKPMPNLGTPAWEKPEMELLKTGELPLLMGFTWIPRRVWLDNPDKPETPCISCGQVCRLIRLSVFAPIGSTKTQEGGVGRFWRDPHVLYSTSANDEVISLHAADVRAAPDAAAGQWARIIAGNQKVRQADDRIGTWIVGFSTVNNDTYLEATESLVRDPFLPEQSEAIIARLERWQKEGSKLARKARPPNEKVASRKHVEILPMLDGVRPHVESKVFADVGELLVGDDEAWEQAAAKYRPMMRMVARSLAPGFTTEALRRRRTIQFIVPNMKPKPEPVKKDTRKKGGASE